MNLRALRTVPRRSWWTLAITTLIVVAFVFDRNLGAVLSLGVLLYALVIQNVRGDRAHQYDEEPPATNPSTGLSMTGATDAGGFFYGEDTFERHHLD